MPSEIYGGQNHIHPTLLTSASGAVDIYYTGYPDSGPQYVSWRITKREGNRTYYEGSALRVPHSIFDAHGWFTPTQDHVEWWRRNIEGWDWGSFDLYGNITEPMVTQSAAWFSR